MEEDKYITWQVQLLIRCKDELILRTGQEISLTAAVPVFEQVNKWLLSDRIQSERGKVRSDKETTMDEPATPAQIKFIKDLGGHVVDGMTKKQASQLIEDLKK